MNKDLDIVKMPAETLRGALFSRKKLLTAGVWLRMPVIEPNPAKRRSFPAALPAPCSQDVLPSQMEMANPDSQPTKQAYLGQP